MQCRTRTDHNENWNRLLLPVPTDREVLINIRQVQPSYGLQSFAGAALLQHGRCRVAYSELYFSLMIPLMIRPVWWFICVYSRLCVCQPVIASRYGELRWCIPGEESNEGVKSNYMHMHFFIPMETKTVACLVPLTREYNTPLILFNLTYIHYRHKKLYKRLIAYHYQMSCANIED